MGFSRCFCCCGPSRPKERDTVHICRCGKCGRAFSSRDEHTEYTRSDHPAEEGGVTEAAAIGSLPSPEPVPASPPEDQPDVAGSLQAAPQAPSADEVARVAVDAACAREHTPAGSPAPDGFPLDGMHTPPLAPHTATDNPLGLSPALLNSRARDHLVAPAPIGMIPLKSTGCHCKHRALSFVFARSSWYRFVN